jgi:hypothetical protein
MKSLLPPHPQTAKMRQMNNSFPASLLAPLLAAALLALCGCGDVEDTNSANATSTLNPSGSFAVVQDPKPSASTTATVVPGSTTIVTNVVDGVTNVVTTVEAGRTNVSSNVTVAVTALGIAAASADASSWSVQATDNAGRTFAGTAAGPALRDPGSGNVYPAGATLATFALDCPGLSGEISAVALVDIPIDVVRTHSTNGTNVVVGRHGQHNLTPQNTQYRLVATLSRDGVSTLTGTAPIAPATIIW